jgi:NADH:ubiquinone oxidoreductase subunit 6 (subunit J)
MTPLFGAVFDWAGLGPILPPLVIGAGSIYLLLPRPRPYPKLWGALLGGLALLLAGVFIVRTGMVHPETILFYAFSAIAIIAGTLLITQHNPARAALSFALVVLSTCGLYLLLAAPFLMAATTIIYAGAIIVTFLFVLMLAQQEGRSNADDRSREPLLATLTGFILLGALLYVLDLSYGTSATSPATREIDTLLADTHQLLNEARAVSGQGSREELAHVLKASEDLLPRYLAALHKPQVRWLDLPDLAAQIDRMSLSWPSVAEPPRDAAEQAAELQRLRKAVADLTPDLYKLEEIGEEARKRLGEQLACLQPRGDRIERYSNLSGPSPAVELTELRRDEQGRPQLPAENSAYLGRSLFTDYLLPVELGGTLLLVATVGAIAIAQRRTYPERPL